ncbi:TAP42-like protein [Russula earlei]|uniref:TAP42-like protein n=1 Tax=Russula earlei TaxID=71964 RepID=A0ACC0UHB3_9AGAM|nr:TAP42-like protein [Russula earlei]
MESPSTVFRRALLNVSKASNLPTIKDETQELIHIARTDCRNTHARVADLVLFSPNETLDDISTQDLVYLFVPYVSAEIEARARATERDERLVCLRESEKGFTKFVSDIELYQIVSKSERELYEKNSSIANPALRRETKIKQYQTEKEIRGRIEAVAKRHRVPLPPAETSPTDFDLIAALLPPPGPAAASLSDDGDSEDEQRTATLLLLRLAYLQAQAQLANITQELELLRTASPLPPDRSESSDRARSSSEADRSLWTLDAPLARSVAAGGGPLLDSAGKPLQPFTILPSGAGGDRARLREQVFQPGYRLPTMSIDEYLEIERQRGNILTGGGSSLMLNRMGRQFGDAKSEEKRRKDEEWARFTDANPRGAGNTMNRG